jgi:hypothetical protein
MIDLAEAIRDAHGVADIAALDRARGQLADLLFYLETRRCGPGAVKVCPNCRASLNGAATCRRCRVDPAMVQAVERRGRTLTGAAMLALVRGDGEGAVYWLDRARLVPATPAVRVLESWQTRRPVGLGRRRSKSGARVQGRFGASHTSNTSRAS